MAEAHGTVLVRASPRLIEQLDLQGSHIDHEAMLALFNAASVPAAKIKAALGARPRQYPLLNPEIYRREYLQRALALGALLVFRRGDVERPRSELHNNLSSLEHNVASKLQIANDMLDLGAFDLNAVCKGYGERHGTALALAAQNGLLPIVQRLLAMGADPMPGTDECALDAASSALGVMPHLEKETGNLCA